MGWLCSLVGLPTVRMRWRRAGGSAGCDALADRESRTDSEQNSTSCFKVRNCGGREAHGAEQETECQSERLTEIVVQARQAGKRRQMCTTRVFSLGRDAGRQSGKQRGSQ